MHGTRISCRSFSDQLIITSLLSMAQICLVGMHSPFTKPSFLGTIAEWHTWPTHSAVGLIPGFSRCMVATSILGLRDWDTDQNVSPDFKLYVQVDEPPSGPQFEYGMFNTCEERRWQHRS